jgi:hypothetical protein
VTLTALDAGTPRSWRRLKLQESNPLKLRRKNVSPAQDSTITIGKQAGR